ncbi:hypothetical protein BCR33DRAFT_582777 [Rhizoclosmatium globosum]|uniref:Uncharacterized protein n=1 Tax=Rhizoclosmatium globosum TaxID=329046 RepID=A0A1Y2CQZ1_9FUNG|nr:hypothetical protein BCR33DRAFT_582777 [Rhizoclosmatium globosum]|eukprot:ORY49432.1 hypothetical protein BCR33DRAFT_582777 [Rhizoclosmatium globosum]
MRHYYRSCKAVFLAICGAVSLVGVLSNMNDYDRFRVTTHAPFWYPLFEISITAWFMTCRMSEEWKQIVEIDLNMLIDSIQSLTKFVEITMREELTVEPIGYFMRVMLREMRKDLQDGTIETADQLALTGMSTTSDGNYYGYLGLLGVEVGQGLCWKGRNEDTWREFWKQQGMV